MNKYDLVAKLSGKAHLLTVYSTKLLMIDACIYYKKTQLGLRAWLRAKPTRLH